MFGKSEARQRAGAQTAMTRANGPDPRFCSAAIFADDGKALKANVRPALVHFGWKNSGAWRWFENRHFHFAMPSSDLSPWEIGLGLTGGMRFVFLPRDVATQSVALRPALRLIQKRHAGFRSTSLDVSLTEGESVSIGYSEHGEKTWGSYRSYKSGTPMPARQLLKPWQGCRKSSYTSWEDTGSQPVEMSSCWTVDDILKLIGDTPRYCVEFEDAIPAEFDHACNSFEQETTGRCKWLYFGICYEPETFDELSPQVISEVPGYFAGSFFASYRKGFDPYARPAAADAGQTVRYPLVSLKRRRLCRGGEKDIWVDLVHRPQGECYFDLQVVHDNAPDDKWTRTTLVEAIATLDVKAEVWDGDPMVRWQ